MTGEGRGGSGFGGFLSSSLPLPKNRTNRRSEVSEPVGEGREWEVRASTMAVMLVPCVEKAPAHQWGERPRDSRVACWEGVTNV